MRCLLCGIALVWASGSAAAPATATPAQDVIFEWDAPEVGCPDAAVVVAELERLLGNPLAEERGRRLTAIARVRAEPDGTWDLRLWTVTPTATRYRGLSDDSCETLGRAAALLAALAIDPEVMSRGVDDDAAETASTAKELPAEDPPPLPGPESEPGPEPDPVEPPSPPDPDPTEEPERAPEPASPARPIHGGLGLEGGVTFGDLPGAGPFIRLVGGVGFERSPGFGVAVDLTGTYTFERRGRFDDRPDDGADLQLASGGVRGCPLWTRSVLQFGPCGGVEVGGMFGRGVGLSRLDSASVLWLAASVDALAQVRLGRRVRLGLLFEGLFPLVRSEMTIEGIGRVWRPAAVGLRAGATVGLVL